MSSKKKKIQKRLKHFYLNSPNQNYHVTDMFKVSGENVSEKNTNALECCFAKLCIKTLYRYHKE